MREIEIKARITDKPALLKQVIRNNILLSEPITQRDQVFGLPDTPGGTVGRPWLRIRTETRNGIVKYLFTLKKSVTNQLDSIEHETEIVDAIELEQIINHLDFSPYSDLTKTRRKAQVGDIEICVDSVAGLGDFIEAEKLTREDANYEEVVGELWKLLESLGVSKDDKVTDGYDTLQRKLDGLPL